MAELSQLRARLALAEPKARLAAKKVEDLRRAVRAQAGAHGYVITLALLPDGVHMSATRPDGSFDSSYSVLPDKRIPANLAKLLAELRAQVSAGS